MARARAQARTTAIALVSAASLLAGCGTATSARPLSHTHVVTDMSGAKVRVPDKVTRIAEQFPAHTAMDIMLGMGTHLVAIPQNVSTIPFLRLVDPGITKVPQLFPSDGNVNIEELLKTKPDLVSSTGSGPTVQQFKAVGLPAVDMTFTNFPGLIRSVRLAGNVYGGVARARAAAYITYLRAKMKMIRSTIDKAHLRPAQKPSVVHIASYPPLTVDGGDSIVEQWIQTDGGTDAAAGLKGTHLTVSMEQLLKWNPAVLIIETPGGDQGLVAKSALSVLASLSKAAGWSDLKAVKDHRVYMDPQGLYPWDRFGPEEALQIQWAAKVLHPKLFKSLNMRSVTRSFYKRFFSYDPTDQELNDILQTTAASGIASANT